MVFTPRLKFLTQQTTALNKYMKLITMLKIQLSFLKQPLQVNHQQNGSRKAKIVSHSFTFNINCREEVICKTFFLNTLSISETFMRYALSKVNRNGLVISDLRVKHVPGNKIPEDGSENTFRNSPCMKAITVGKDQSESI